MKRIVIVGGGISGLAVLHFLKQRFNNDVQITLFEREAQLGGTIRSFKKDSFLFEWGPNGFLDNQPDTLQLIHELGLDRELIETQANANLRYIQINGHLYTLPHNPIDFIRTPLLSSKNKWALISGIFNNNISTDCSIHEYVSKRFSPEIAEILADPFISGVYAGNIKSLHMATAFPKFKRHVGQRSRMRSLKQGMSQIIEALFLRYKDSIQTSTEISSLPQDADITILATPAYAAAKIIGNRNLALGKSLEQITYAPVAVVGLAFKQEAFKHKPDGFGYLIPSREKKEVLGVLIESNVYGNRAQAGQVMMRVMLGGSHHPNIIHERPERITAKAVNEIDSTYGLIENPLEGFIKIWPQAIPQYELNYPKLSQSISQECAKISNLYLCANYWGGISFNDCIHNAKSLARGLAIC